MCSSFTVSMFIPPWRPLVSSPYDSVTVVGGKTAVADCCFGFAPWMTVHPLLKTPSINCRLWCLRQKNVLQPDSLVEDSMSSVHLNDSSRCLRTIILGCILMHVYQYAKFATLISSLSPTVLTSSRTAYMLLNPISRGSDSSLNSAMHGSTRSFLGCHVRMNNAPSPIATAD